MLFGLVHFMKKRIVCTVAFLTTLSAIVYGQAAYMREVYEDSRDSGDSLLDTVFCALLFFGIVWVVTKVSDTHKEKKEKSEQIRYERDCSTRMASTYLQNHEQISKYQTKKSWQKGFANATYDISHHNVKELTGKNVEDLIKEYRFECEMGHLVKAESVMEKIGYFQKIELYKKERSKDNSK